MKRLVISMMVFCSLMMVSAAAWCDDNGNGTVTIGNLVVLKDAGCLGIITWNDATAKVKTIAQGACGGQLTDKSKPGDWRLPTLDELKAMHAAKSQFKNVQNSCYWSSSTYAGDAAYAWVVCIRTGNPLGGYKGHYYYIWPVRKK